MSKRPNMNRSYARETAPGGFLIGLSSRVRPEHVAGAVAILGIVVLVVLVWIR